MFAEKPKEEFAIHGSLIAVRLFNGLSPVPVSVNLPGDSQATATTSNLSNHIAFGLSGRDIKGTNLTVIL